MKIRRYRGSIKAETGRWILVILALIGLSYYLVKQRPELINQFIPGAIATPTPEPTPAPTPEPTATPTPTPSPTPEPVVETPTPTPTPEPTATPVVVATPTPEELLDFATIATNPAFWPKQVTLLQKTAFSLVFNGKVAGQVQAPAGILLQLVRVLPDTAKPQVEVLFQNSREIVSASLLDLVPRATAIKKAVAARAALQGSAPQSTPSPVPSAMPGVKFADRVTIEVIRQKQIHKGMDDYDDKRDDVSMKVKVINSDITRSFEKVRGSIYILAENLTSPNMVKVIGQECFDFSLAPRGTFETVTAQVTSGNYDDANDGSRYGYRYSGWFVRITDASGAVLMEKATTPSLLKHAEQIVNTSTGEEFNRTAKPKP